MAGLLAGGLWSCIFILWLRRCVTAIRWLLWLVGTLAFVVAPVATELIYHSGFQCLTFAFAPFALLFAIKGRALHEQILNTQSKAPPSPSTTEPDSDAAAVTFLLIWFRLGLSVFVSTSVLSPSIHRWFFPDPPGEIEVAQVELTGDTLEIEIKGKIRKMSGSDRSALSIYFLDIGKMLTDRNRSAYPLKLLPRERYMLLREPKGGSGLFSTTIHEGEVIRSPDDDKAILSLPVKLIEGREFRVWRSDNRCSVRIAGMPLPTQIPANTDISAERNRSSTAIPSFRSRSEPRS